MRRRTRVAADAVDRSTHRLLRQINRGLAAFDADGEPVLDIRPAAVYHDGSPAWAQEYVRGWSHAANGPHGRQLAVTGAR